MPASKVELDRLDFNHTLIVKLISYGEKLFLAPVQQEKTHRILDIGTGTGICRSRACRNVLQLTLSQGLSRRQRSFLMQRYANESWMVQARLIPVIDSRQRSECHSTSMVGLPSQDHMASTDIFSGARPTSNSRSTTLRARGCMSTSLTSSSAATCVQPLETGRCS